jgi:very-short-patch-repair endonuclease
VGGAKFSRQMPVGPYFCNFLCREHKLIIEVDGPSYDQMLEGDAARTRYLNTEGYRVLRFTNDEVIFGLEGVIAAIEAVLMPTPALRPTPPASGRGDK